MVTATMDYRSRQRHPHQYSDDLAIEEFIGRPGRGDSVQKYRHDTGNSVSKQSITCSIDSASETSSPHSSVGNGRGRVRKERSISLDADPSPGQGRDTERMMLELPITSNPLIPESTDFSGDTRLPFFTPSSSGVWGGNTLATATATTTTTTTTTAAAAAAAANDDDDGGDNDGSDAASCQDVYCTPAANGVSLADRMEH